MICKEYTFYGPRNKGARRVVNLETWDENESDRINSEPDSEGLSAT